MLLVKIIGSILLIILPGFSIYCLLYKRHPIKASELFTATLFSILIISITGLSLAELKQFNLTNLTAIIFGFTALFLLWKRDIIKRIKLQNYIDEINAHTSDYVIPLLILIFCVIILFPGYQWIYGGRDPGIYINTGVNLAKTGQLKTYDSEITEMTQDEVKAFLHYENRPEIIRHKGYLFVGFYLSDTAEGEITPQFFSLYQVWIALGYCINGLSGAINITPLFGTLGILATYFFTKVNKGKKHAILTGFLSLLSFSQVWWSKYPNAEIATQVMFWGALFILSQKENASKTILPLFAGLLFGLQYLTTIQTYIIFPILFLIALFIKDEQTNFSYRRFLIGNILLLIYSFLHAYGFTLPYFNARWGEMFKSQLPTLSLLIAGIISLGTIFLVVQSQIKKYIPFLNKLFSETSLKIIINVLLLLAIFVGIFRIPNSNFNENGYNLIKLSYYVGFIGLISLWAGGWVCARSKNFYDKVIVLIMFLSLTYMLYNASISRDHPWWSRRFFPIVLGAFPYLTSVFIFYFLKAKRKVYRYGVVLFTIALILALSGLDLLLFNFQEHPNAIEQISFVNDKISENSIILFPRESGDREDFLAGYFLAQPLRFIYGHKTYLLGTSDTNLNSAKEKIDEWLAGGETIYILGDNISLNNFFLQNYYLKEIETYQIDFQQRGWRSVFYPEDLLVDNHLMQVITTYSINDVIYQILPKTNTANTITSQVIEIGNDEEGLLGLEGIYQKEGAGDINFRWTKPEFKLTLPQTLQENVSVELYASLLQAVDERTVMIDARYCGNTYRHEFNTLLDFQEIKITFEKGCVVEKNTIEFAISPALLPKNDGRELGIALDKIQITVDSAD